MNEELYARMYAYLKKNKKTTLFTLRSLSLRYGYYPEAITYSINRLFNTANIGYVDKHFIWYEKRPYDDHMQQAINSFK